MSYLPINCNDMKSFHAYCPIGITDTGILVPFVLIFETSDKEN